MPILRMFICVQTLEIVKCSIGYYLVKSRKWVKDLVSEPEAPAVEF